ncbi:MAG: 4Fe-4S dicluster domain-containing protein [Deltaproteobacteria bacterium]|nr:4Fe-4S dicluster domain-containing protein [Deltaproteobacteria bacterium]
MSHVTLKSGYPELVERLNRFPQGAPPSETLYKILKLLFSEREAGLVAQLPIKPFTAAQASRIWKMDLTETRRVLDELAGRAILVDIELEGQSTYTLPPPMAGFFEFSLMRLRGDIDQKVLSELLYQYLNVEEEFIRDLFVRGETQLGRVFVHEPVLSNENSLHVLDYERASEVIRTATHRGVGLCYCRHKMMHLGRSCEAPLDICMTLNNTAQSLTRHGYARSVDVREGLDLLQRAYGQNLVQFGENVREHVNFICNCCGCCCEAMIAAREFGMLNPVHTSNFLPVVDEVQCNGCGQCVGACPVEAMTLVSANDAHHPKMKKAKVQEDICLGCGVCVRTCTRKGMSLRVRPARVITPLNSVHRAVMMAIERGDFQNLLFDNRVLWQHRALAAVLGVVLRLPPIKQAMASRQIKSRYMEYLITHIKI